MSLVITLACLGSLVPASLRWLRVAQREHYEPRRVSRFERLWSPTWAIFSPLAAAAAALLSEPLVALPTAAWTAFGPPGLTVRGRTAPLAWTRRLRTTAGTLVACYLVIFVPVAVLGRPWVAAVILCLFAPFLVDVALAITAPFERRAAGRYVEAAAERLREIDPTVVAITGSYGKTTTKGYVRHLVEGARRVVVSPASFNNTAGLSRTVNEQLTPGTEVFVAEMGAYQPGEIAQLCSWVRPRVAAICAIGPVHLERYGTLDRIVEAKSEILQGATVAVLNIDAHGLSHVADAAEADGQRVVRVSAAHSDADVFVTHLGDQLAVEVYGSPLASIDADGRHPTNVAVAVGIALALDISGPHIADRLPGLPATEHRQTVQVAPSGVVVIDDTFNSNPAGAAAALGLLERHRLDGHRAVVVTPGMIELGDLQDDENRRFATEAARLATDVLIVGRTNRGPLLDGAREGRAAVQTMATRDDAVSWVRTHLTRGDVVLYENDLPDHYP